MRRTARWCSVDGCGGKYYATGWCKKHYERMNRHGSLEGRAALSTEERFEVYVDRTNTVLPEHRPELGPCHLWTGSTTPDGDYGTFYYEGRGHTAHRVAVLLEDREIPEGHDVDHLCFVTLCVRGGHLEPVTVEENRRRREVRQGALRTPEMVLAA